MFRELSQKKNIITLTLIVWLLISYISMPVCAINYTDGIENEIVDKVQSVETIVETDYGVAAEQAEVQEEVVEEIVVEEAIVETIEPTLSEPNSQTTVESEVIDEYFDDAHTTGNYQVPSINTNFKSYTYYALLNKSSIQWKLQELAYTDENGLRKIGNYYLAAMGSYYSTTIGDMFRLTTDTGAVFDIILCDAKSDRHTDARHMYTKSNNCMVEFYVDTTVLNGTIKRMGSIGVLPEFSGSIVKVESLGHYEW